MADPVLFLTPRDVDLLREMRELIKRMPINVAAPQPTQVHSPYADTSQGPEVYVFRTKAGGIPNAVVQSNHTGTGSIYDYLIPGVADCRCLSFIEDPTLGAAGDGLFQVIDTLEYRVYNISFDDIPEFSWVLCIRVKSGQFIAVGTISPPDTGTGSVRLGCYLKHDSHERITLDLDELFGDGFEEETGTGSCPSIRVALGCYLVYDSDGNITIDLNKVFNNDFGTDTGTGDCLKVSIPLGCYLRRDEDGAIEVDIPLLFKQGFENATGTGHCPGVRVSKDYVNDIISAIPYGCGIIRVPITGIVRLNLSTIANDALEWDNDTCLLNVVPGCHLEIQPPLEDEVVTRIGIDVPSLAGDASETGLKPYDGADCTPLANDYGVAKTEEQIVLVDSRDLKIGTTITQVNIYALNEYSFNAANELISWQQLTQAVRIRSIDICSFPCNSGTGTGDTDQFYFCISYTPSADFFSDITEWPFVSPNCILLTVDVALGLVDAGWDVSGPYATEEECEEACSTGTGTGTSGGGIPTPCCLSGVPLTLQWTITGTFSGVDGTFPLTYSPVPPVGYDGGGIFTGLDIWYSAVQTYMGVEFRYLWVPRSGCNGDIMFCVKDGTIFNGGVYDADNEGTGIYSCSPFSQTGGAGIGVFPEPWGDGINPSSFVITIGP